MRAIEWLSTHAPGFADLPDDDRQAIMEFSLLWSLFEAKALDANASAKAIELLVQRWSKEGKLNGVGLDEHVDYFRDRYFDHDDFIDRFEKLNFRRNDKADLVKAVLRGEQDGAVEAASALLIIVYRLRNNLFHGEKWAYELREQSDNFCHANAVLMRALEANANLGC
jgi:hypothetical protein